MSPHEVLAAVAIGIGLFFVAIGAIGFLRLPDVFCRLHVTGVVDTLGAPMIMIGAAIYLGGFLAAKLVLGVLFLVLTSPFLGHLLARAALEAGHEPIVFEDAGDTPGRRGGGAA